MIISKGNLKVVDMTAPDKNIPVLDNVLIEKDGTTVGANSRATLVVSPPAEEIRKKVPLESSELAHGITVSSDSIRAVIKAIPRDAMFSGLLEHCDVADSGESGVSFTITDGKREHGIEGKKYPRRFIDYKTIVSEAVESKKIAKVAINRKRLIQMLKTIEAIIPDSNGESPIFLEFSENNDVLIRAVNPANKQRVIGVMTSYKDAEAKWLPFNDWEAQFISLKSLFPKRKGPIPK